MLRTTAMVCGLGLCSACVAFSAPVPDVELVVTDVSVETPGYLAIRFTITNASNRTVFLSNCNGYVRPSLAVREPSGREDFHGLFCPAILSSAPVPLPPGAIRNGSGSVGRLSGATYTPTLSFFRSLDGTFWGTARGPSFVSP